MIEKKGGSKPINTFLRDPELLGMLMTEVSRQLKIKQENKLMESPETKALALLKRNKRMNEEEAFELKNHTKDLKLWTALGNDPKDFKVIKKQKVLIMYVVKRK